MDIIPPTPPADDDRLSERLYNSFQIVPASDDPPPESKNQWGNAEPPAFDLDKKERRSLRESIKQELADHTLEPWAMELCRWLARQPDITKFVSHSYTRIRKPLIAAATALADRPVRREELKQIINSTAWMRLWTKERGTMVDREVQDAKEKFMTLVPKAMTVAHKSFDHVQGILDGDDVRKDAEGNVIEVIDKVSAVRAISPMVGKVLDTSIPKSQVGTTLQAQVINIHLSPDQQQGLALPALTVEAEEVTVEPLDPPQLPAA